MNTDSGMLCNTPDTVTLLSNVFRSPDVDSTNLKIHYAIHRDYPKWSRKIEVLLCYTPFLNNHWSRKIPLNYNCSHHSTESWARHISIFAFIPLYHIRPTIFYNLAGEFRHMLYSSQYFGGEWCSEALCSNSFKYIQKLFSTMWLSLEMTFPQRWRRSAYRIHLRFRFLYLLFLACCLDSYHSIRFEMVRYFFWRFLCLCCSSRKVYHNNLRGAWLMKSGLKTFSLSCHWKI